MTLASVCKRGMPAGGNPADVDFTQDLHYVKQAAIMGGIAGLIVLSFIGSVAGLIGGVLLLFRKQWAGQVANFSVPLAAGVLLAVSFLHLFPEAVETTGNRAFSIILAVFVVMFLVERFFFYFHHHRQEGETHAGHAHGPAVGPFMVVGDTIHNFLDGVIIASAYLTNPTLAVVVAFSTFLHETPHEIADFGIFLSMGWTRRKTFLTNFLSALATFPGALLTYYFAGVSGQMTGILMALATGMFLYIATTDFLPEAAHAPRRYLGNQAVYLLLGIVIIIGIGMLVPEVGH
ncbi:hypothetical protein A2Z33_06325 [Candidatus Gottesmanbacteria bacterium RBG_16_52_11]|uniref:ZIP zinc transporter n=1 Tax=Candidatus Gottesmanbacteria bacterium RBG_16_52_11 TaxID=1798374 RepID=A0A1F5YXG2_9BACT|nr:MAG: hypothetical protein A2Z33_06325 [Candidatus Gottesmanbacteria bacterium RBG_16_52_11]